MDGYSSAAQLLRDRPEPLGARAGVGDPLNKPLLTLVAILAALLIVPAAAASGSQFLNYEGYSHSPPGIGSTASATIDTKSINVYVTDGDGASWVGVDSGNADSYDPQNCVNGTGNTGIAWIQTGLENGYGTSPPHLYIEYKPNLDHCAHLIDEGAASYNTSYSASVTHIASGQWSATVNSSSTGTLTLGGSMTNTNYVTEARSDTIGQTTEVDAVFSNTQPWTTSSMSAIPPINNDVYLTNVTTHGFEAIQLSYNGSCYPNKCNIPPPAPVG